MVYVVTGDDCDLDRALALSLADQLSSQGQVEAVAARQRQVEADKALALREERREQQLFEDERLARRLQEQQEGGPLGARGASASDCASCGSRLTGRSCMEYKGRRYHPQCFTCTACNKRIEEPRFREHEGRRYHDHCYTMQFVPKCRICAQHIAADADGSIRYTEHPFFRDRYCRTHADQAVPSCTACTRVQEAGNEWVRLDDGRWLCLACVGTVVMDSRDAAPLYRNVLAFYTRMGMPFPETVPLHVVDGSSMRECLREEGNNHVPHTGVGEMRGLCISHEHVIRTVSRTPGRGGLAVGFHERVIKETVSQSVSAILVLYGLPALLTGTIIAHECMHAFLRFSRCRKLTPAVEEGLCQLMALLWLKEEMQNNTAAQDNTVEGSYFAHAIQTDASPVYGTGLRRAAAAYHAHGLAAVMASVRRSGELPATPGLASIR